MTKKTASVLLAGLLYLVAAGSANPAPAPEKTPAPPAGPAPQNLLIISLSNVSAQHMSLYGYARRTTPKLDAWAKDAWVFDLAFTQASFTLPVAASLFTGMYPYSHKIQVRDINNVLPSSIQTLPEILRDAGYRTAAFTGGLDYYKGFSHMRGFQDAPDNPNFTGFRTTLRQAKKWLARNADRKFMLFIHGYDTHCPFTPSRGFAGKFSGKKGKDVTIITQRCVRGVQTGPDEFRARYSGGCPDFRKSDHSCDSWQESDVRLTRADIAYLSGLYDEKILEMDSLVGDFLAALDRSVYANTIVVILSDHGEMFAKHGRFGRAGTVRGTHYDDVLHVPLLIRLPGTPGRRITGLAQLIDVMPTVLQAVRQPVPAEVQGQDLSPLAVAGTEVNTAVFAGINYNVRPKASIPEDKRIKTRSLTESIRELRWKLIREVAKGPAAPGAVPPTAPSETIELYDLRDDPEELRNILAAQPETAQRLLSVLRGWSEQAKAVHPWTPRTREVPDSLLKEARKRGYW